MLWSTSEVCRWLRRVCAIHIIFAIPDTGDKVAKESKNDNFIQEKCQRSFQILNEIGLESLPWKYITCHTKTWAATRKAWLKENGRAKQVGLEIGSGGLDHIIHSICWEVVKSQGLRWCWSGLRRVLIPGVKARIIKHSSALGAFNLPNSLIW